MDNRISFRSSYETESHVRYLETSGNALSVAEAKVSIAKALGLERDFARKFDLKLLNATERNKPLDDDSELILPGASLIVQRTLWRPVDEVLHEAQPFVKQWVHGDETVASAENAAGAARRLREEPHEAKAQLPKRFLCAHCGRLLENPMTVRCENSCSASVCKVCAETLLANGSPAPATCPVCQKPAVKSFIPNRTLASIINKIDLSTYDLPNVGTIKDERLIGSIKGKTVKEELGASSLEASPQAPPLVESPGYIFFVRPEQIQTVHSRSTLILPANIDELNKDVALSSTAISAYVFALGGGGTSLITPGTAVIKEIMYVGVSPPASPDEAKSPFTKITEESIASVSAGPSAGVVAAWYEKIPVSDRPAAFTICSLEWEVKFQQVLLLPGKAQPIAGIRAGAIQNRTKYGQYVEVIKLNQSQKQGVTARLSQEALFARMNRAASTHPTVSLSQQQPKGAISAAADRDVTPTSSTPVVVSPGVTGAPVASAVSGDYVFDATANAWMTVDRLNKRRYDSRSPSAATAAPAADLDPNAPAGSINSTPQWQVASQLRACFDSSSLFSNLQSPDSVTHWSLVNPLLPYVCQLPKLSHKAFQVIQALQMIALKRLVATENASEFLLSGLNEITGDFVLKPAPTPVVATPTPSKEVAEDPPVASQRSHRPPSVKPTKSSRPPDNNNPAPYMVFRRDHASSGAMPNMMFRPPLRPPIMMPHHQPYLPSYIQHPDPRPQVVQPMIYPGAMFNNPHVVQPMIFSPPRGLPQQIFDNPHAVQPLLFHHHHHHHYPRSGERETQGSEGDFYSGRKKEMPKDTEYDRRGKHDKYSYEKSAHEKPSYERASHEKPSYERASHEKPSYERASHEKLSYERPSYERPTHEKLVRGNRKNESAPPAKRRRHEPSLDGPLEEPPRTSRKEGSQSSGRRASPLVAPTRRGRRSPEWWQQSREGPRESHHRDATTHSTYHQSAREWSSRDVVARESSRDHHDAREAAARLFNASLPNQPFQDSQRQKRFESSQTAAPKVPRRRVSQSRHDRFVGSASSVPASNTEQSPGTMTTARKRPRNSLFT
eukprot:Blabericola_migrator_1__12954@NODE_857_length_6241_cov_107_054746_g607_i0_p1_GENE_NODE_857_length_6241_cov_107_054746_g607_i0NODE_857_length_6241_cov_107_054746_g607_i0_p1_ORF_typecomplete_len1066_score158_69DWNN/PF08783_11/1_5e06zfRING_6/PF14835_6/0_00015Ubox/PF04564_15/0_0014zfRING_10/PF16685_5/0_012Baculo_IE1/PF05290_11/0_015Siva/PF05458_12/0_027zfC3HC4_3/PF13920_6/0_33zfC3HC4_4/PF15227_6/0_45zfC3HC4_2/PF13923_6/0_81zfRING_5/PF14634_6/2ProkRING_4/PF14447_6/5_8DZR/PF12773_7/3e02DZR/PF12773_7/7